MTFFDAIPLTILDRRAAAYERPADEDLANNATSAVASNQVDVHCGGPLTSVNFFIDVFGYYP